MNTLLAIASLAEAVTGAVLLAHPLIVVRLLFGVETTGAGVVMSCMAGVALIGLGVACWPGNPGSQQLYGMLTFSTLAMLYLLRIGIGGGLVGVLLWPGVCVHAVLLVVLVWVRWKQPRTHVEQEAH